MTDHGSPDRPVRWPGLHGLSWLSESELAWLIDRLPAEGLFVEVGTASGCTAALVADARPGLDVVCVDPFADWTEPHVAGEEPARPDLWRRNRRPRMHLWMGDLASLARLSPGLRADAILVDGDHAAEAVASDLRIADRLLRRRGTLFVHDCDEPGLPWIGPAADAFALEHGYAVAGQHWTLRAMRRS